MNNNATVFHDHSGRFRTVWRFIIFFVGYLLCNLGVVLLIVAFLLISGWTTFPELQNMLETVNEPSMTFLYGFSVSTSLFSVFFCLLCRRYLDKRSVRSMGLVKPAPGLSSSIWIGLGLGFLSITIPVIVLHKSGNFDVNPSSFSWEPFLLLPVLSVAALHEELFCRGYLYRNLLDVQKPVFGLLFSSLVFWLMHVMNLSHWSSIFVPVNLFLSGILLALAYNVSANIWFPTAMHLGWNYAQGGIFGIPISGIKVIGFVSLNPAPGSSQLLTGGRFGLEGSVFVTIIEICLILVFLTILMKRKKAANHFPVC